jgi:hypothetical protein
MTEVQRRVVGEISQNSNLNGFDSRIGVGIDSNNSLTEIGNNPKKDNNAIAGNGKIVSFVGTSKNGTSFIINNLARLMADQNINVAIVDLTKNKNSYYMYTDNEEALIKKAEVSLKNLSNGDPTGLEVGNCLTLYTAIPEDVEDTLDKDKIFNTLSKNYDIALLDCDFRTDVDFFNKSDEVYIVQSMDALTIQPLTKFLSELKTKDLLDENKMRVIVNKHVRLKSLTTKMIIAGMSRYNAPSMSLQRDIFNKDNMKYIEIPFEEEVYIKYIEEIASCKITLNGYTQSFVESLEKLKNMVYPLVATKKSKSKKKKNQSKAQ